jgi:hypothetical protein
MNPNEAGQTIADFIQFNSPILKEIRESDESVANALTQVISDLFDKYVLVKTIEESTKKETQISSGKQGKPIYKIGDKVESLSNEFQGVGVVNFISVTPPYVYYVTLENKTSVPAKESDLIFVESNTNTEITSMTDSELLAELEGLNELMEIYEDPSLDEYQEAEAKKEIVIYELTLRGIEF